eukprot:694211-Prorocentrum_minimum.AAC.1
MPMLSNTCAFQVVNVVNEVFFAYDNLVTQHNTYKVETIGDSFMCAGGVPNKCCPVQAAGSVAEMAFGMLEVGGLGSLTVLLCLCHALAEVPDRA